MEYCAGGDLSTFIRSRRTIPEKYVRRFVQQIGKYEYDYKLKMIFTLFLSLCIEALTFNENRSN